MINEFVNEHKGGSPTDPDLFWLYFYPSEISKLIFSKSKVKIPTWIIKRQLQKLGFKYRKLSKQLPTGIYKERNIQFGIIMDVILAVNIDSTPIISIDCKKKEVIGTLYREGKSYSTGPIKVYDHDYSHLSEGKVIPHGIYDLQRNEGYVTIGNSHETAEFVTDNVLWWWDNYGIHQYPDTKSIVILCDAGGANSYRHHIFKVEIQKLASIIGKEIIVCHYPPYASKWNPIEHRLFSHIHRSMQGVVFNNYEIVKILIEKTSTQTGLIVVARIVDKKYKIGIKVSKNDIKIEKISYNEIIPKLNYKITP